jgi:hypothetical protein
MAVRHSTRYCSVIAALLLAATALGIHGLLAVQWSGPSLAHTSSLVRALQLTDLCLFTEASYTRHLSMADLNTPFQDSPLAFEHFPSGSLVTAPKHLSGNVSSRMTVTKNGR